MAFLWEKAVIVKRKKYIANLNKQKSQNIILIIKHEFFSHFWYLKTWWEIPPKVAAYREQRKCTIVVMTWGETQTTNVCLWNGFVLFLFLELTVHCFCFNPLWVETFFFFPFSFLHFVDYLFLDCISVLLGFGFYGFSSVDLTHKPACLHGCSLVWNIFVLFMNKYFSSECLVACFICALTGFFFLFLCVSPLWLFVMMSWWCHHHNWSHRFQ